MFSIFSFVFVVFVSFILMTTLVHGSYFHPSGSSDNSYVILSSLRVFVFVRRNMLEWLVGF